MHPNNVVVLFAGLLWYFQRKIFKKNVDGVKFDKKMEPHNGKGN